MMNFQDVLKISLKKKCETLLRDKSLQFPIRCCGKGQHANDLLGSGVHDLSQHEFRFIDKSPLHLWVVHKTIPLTQVVFCDCKGCNSRKRTIVSLGLSGIGKSLAVQSVALDWVECKKYHYIDLLFVLSFWELNLLESREMSFVELLYTFYPDLRGLDVSSLKGPRVWFILDGLDECRLPLNFSSNPVVTDVRGDTTVDRLLTNLIRGDLVPDCHIWITTRPAAAKRIPPDHVLMLTEMQGFSNEQKEQFFRSVIGNRDLADRAFDHVKMSRSLHFLCQIPQVCLNFAYVLKEHVMESDCEFAIKPMNLTQIHAKLVKAQVKSDEKTLRKLEKLALNRFGKDNVIYAEDLKESGISLEEAAKFCKRCPLLFIEERGIEGMRVYRFGHRVVQEYLAASVTLDRLPLENLFQACRAMVDEAVKSSDGHRDVFYRFIFGLLKERGLMMPTDPPVIHTESKILEIILTDNAVSLIHCLNEFDPQVLKSDVKSYVKSGDPPLPGFSALHWSFLLQRTNYMEGTQDQFSLAVGNRNDWSLPRHLPNILKSKTAMLRFSNLTEQCCPALVSVLCFRNSHLRELDLGYNTIADTGVKKLLEGLNSQDCKLKRLRLHGCGVTSHGCSYLASILSSSPKLRLLDLSANNLGDDGLQSLSRGIGSSGCELEVLRLSQCNIEEKGCGFLSAALKKKIDHLRSLDLSINDIRDAGAIQIFRGIDISRLSALTMYCCKLTTLSCENLFKDLKSEPERNSQLELNLSNNDLKDLGFRLICKGMDSCGVETLNVSRCGITDVGCVHLARVLSSDQKKPCVLKDLDLSMNYIKDNGVKAFAEGLKNPHGHLKRLNLSHCSLTQGCCAELASGFSHEDCDVIELDLCGNDIQDKGMKRLCSGFRSLDCKIEKLLLRRCGLTSNSVLFLLNALRANPTHMSELHLMGNDLDEMGVCVMTDLLVNPVFQLHTLDISSEYQRVEEDTTKVYN